MSLRSFVAEHKLAVILTVGIIARLILMPITAHPFDVYAWYNISTSIIQNGPLSVNFFPPLYGHYMMVPVAYAYDWLAGVFPSWTGPFPLSSLPAALNPDSTVNIQFVPGLLFNFVAKIPFLISDILVTLLLYKTVEHISNNKGLAGTAALFWFLNPFVIWISAGWGMWDTLPVLFSLATFYLLLKKKIALSALCLSLAVASKLYPLLFLAPVIVYFLKSSPPSEKRRNIVRFLLVFSVVFVLLFAPYFGEFARFFGSGTFGLQFTASVGSGGIPISLSYWSLFSLNLLFKSPLVYSLAYQASAFSPVLVAVALALVYWKTTKMTFENAAFDLSSAVVLSVLALFLSFRLFCEQWFVWLLPFAIILCVRGKVSSVIYWGASFVGLAFVFLNCLLPFFFLPLAPWVGNSLLSMASSLLSVWSLRIVSLAFLGSLFSFLLVILVYMLLRNNKLQPVD